MNKYPCYLEIDLDKIYDNVNYLKDISKKDFIFVCKANGYGLIDFKMCRYLSLIGVKFFAVSSLIEAISLRKNGIIDEILILGYVEASDLDLVRKYDLSIISSSYGFVCNSNLENIKVHIKLNTGMNRLGIKVNQLANVYEMLVTKKATIEGIMSHLYDSDNLETNQKQYQLFKDAIICLNKPFKYIHISATNGSINLNDDLSSHIRVGIGVLGFADVSSRLKPAVSLYALITSIKEIEKDENVSYCKRYVAAEKEKIATISIGYADGYNRLNTGNYVYYQNQNYQIIGAICMDQLCIKADDNLQLGQYVEMYGEHISVEELAIKLNTIVYEIFVNTSSRVTRVYKQNNQVIDEYNPILKSEML